MSPRRCGGRPSPGDQLGRACRRQPTSTIGLWGFGGQDKLDLLADAYRNVLRVADELGAATIAMPAISAGTFGFPAETAADVALRTVRDHLQADTAIERVTFVLRGAAVEAFERRLATI